MKACVAGLAAVCWALFAAPASAQDACPNGWSPEETVEFAPPVPAVDSGVANVEGADGCTLLDAIWEGEPFSSHGLFVAHVVRVMEGFELTPAERRAVLTAAGRSQVGTAADVQLDNSCPRRIAFTFDDGTSFYRPRTLQVLRDKQVHGNFFDNGFRVAANPQIAVFQVREGHVQLNHTYNHVDMSEMSDEGNREEVLSNEALFAAIGAPLTFKGIRPPFGGSNPRVRALLDSMGYTYFLDRIGTDDWIPERTAGEIHEAIVEQLEPGAIVALHDGPGDTPAGAASVDALGRIIDSARGRGYCFGVVDRTGEVVADRYVSSDLPIPQIVNPVPYHRLVFGTVDMIEGPFLFTESPLELTATHRPSTFVRGQTGTLTLTVANDEDEPTDGEIVTVTDAIPAGLTATAAGGEGWTCSGTRTVRCTRTDALAPGAAYPAINITVSVAAGAPATVTNTPLVEGHGGAWTDEASDRIGVSDEGG